MEAVSAAIEDDVENAGSLSAPHNVRIWKVASWNELEHKLGSRYVAALKFSPTTNLLVVVCHSGAPILIDTKSGQIRHLKDPDVAVIER